MHSSNLRHHSFPRQILLTLLCTTTAICSLKTATGTARADTPKFFGDDTDGGDNFGFAIAMHGDKAVVGAPERGFEGSAYLFDLPQATQNTVLTPSIAVNTFGYSVGIDNSRAIVGARYTTSDTALNVGSVHVFDVETGDELWYALSPADTRFDEFGVAVDINETYALVGAQGEDPFVGGAAYVYDAATGEEKWRLAPDIPDDSERFGSAVAISGDIGLIGAQEIDSSVGSAYLFDLESGDQLHKLTISDSNGQERFGASVDIQGNLALVGAPLFTHDVDAFEIWQGAAYLFDVESGEQLFQFAPDDLDDGGLFGSSVTLWENFALIGQPSDDDGEPGDTGGEVYLFDTTTGEQLARFRAEDRESGDSYGAAVALNSFGAIVGAPDEDERGNYSAGAAYFFAVPEPHTGALAVSALAVMLLCCVRKPTLRKLGL